MKIPHIHFDHDAHLYNFGDSHVGNENFNKELFKKIVKAVHEDPIARAFSTGDILEAGLKDSKSDCYTGMNVGDEYEWFMDETECIRDRWLFITPGNHEERILKSTGDKKYVKRMAKDLGIKPEFYQGWVNKIKITCGRASYFIASSHGAGGGTIGNSLNNLVKFSKIYPGFCLYCQGHTHKFIGKPTKYPYLNKKLGSYNYLPVMLCCTGHLISYEGSYAERMQLEPEPEGVATITLKANNSGNAGYKKIEVELFN